MPVRRKRSTRKGQVRKTARRAYTTRTTPTRRRRRTKKSMLSDFMSPTMAKAGAKATISGAVGGAGAGLLSKLLPATYTEKQKGGIQILAGFLTTTLVKLPNVGAGMSAIGMYNILTDAGFLSDSGEYDSMSYAEDIEMLPPVLSEAEGMYLQEQDGMYLQDQGGMYLQDDNPFSVGMYGDDFGQA